ncbi:hypothetical protein GCM10010872_34350 [Dyella flava]|nr:hypothetical protein GCM10010872_34350 [Dyella flava]
MWCKYILIMMIAVSSTCFAYESVKAVPFYAYYDGNSYEYLITPDMVAKAPNWDPGQSPNPTLLASQAPTSFISMIFRFVP